MLYRDLVEGGIYFMLPIYLLGIAVIVLTLMHAYRLITGKVSSPAGAKKTREAILFMGSLALLWGIVGHVLGMMEMMDCLVQAGDIAPALIAAGFKVSILAMIYGLILFVVSYIVWFASRALSK